MKLIKTIIFTLLMFNLDLALACPGCAGSMGNRKDSYTVYILMTFIALTYIPFFIIYKTIIKHRKSSLNQNVPNEQVQ
ncbi:MAG: hypothetical protein KC493_04610 [Bacteriovoracaceae bacterium]|nr:hypothetical protein [Bacteriovoracaceae bacterium]